ncbi:MAG: hypothetical protein WCP20_08155 [Desulfuromonadales bacterium]
MATYDLYFDESGNFEDYAFIEEGIKRAEQPQKASQLVGILALHGQITKDSAEKILSSALKKAGLPLKEQIHANKILSEYGRDVYSSMLDDFLLQMKQRNGIQSLRIWNNAKIGFGDKVATYTSMVAEMVVRIFEILARTHGNRKIEMNIIAARVRTNGHERNAPQQFINEADYKRRISEQIAFAAIRRGVAHNQNNWLIGSFRFDSGLKYRPLQLCDLLSHASYRNFKNCFISSRKAKLKELLGEYDLMLNRTAVLEEIEHLSQDGSIAQAIQAIAENWDRPELEENVRQDLKEHRTSLVKLLADMPASNRNIHLRQIADWGSLFLAVRDLDLSDRMLKWLERWIVEPLCNEENSQCNADVYWFKAQLLNLRLEQYNHCGELAAARPIIKRLHELFPKLAGQWEHAPLLTKAMTLEAVHRNDCFEYDEATHLMSGVGDYYVELSSLMSVALPGIFPERVKSQNHGRALGTKLQSEMFAGLSNPIRLDNARKLNELALDEFTSEDDRLRQYQYRCQIDTYAGNFADARTWLAKSLGVAPADTPTHTVLSEKIKILDGIAQGFALLHWTRIAMEAGRRGYKEELQQFCNVFKLNESPWINQNGQEYPSHGIRRHLAVAFAHAGRINDSQELVNSLRQFNTTKKEALELIRLAGCAEAAALWGWNNVQIIRRLFQEPSRPLLTDLNNFELATVPFPALKAIASRLHAACNKFITSGCIDKSEITSVCRLVGQ